MEEKGETIQEVQPCEEAPEPPCEAPEPPAEPVARKRGRPAGAKDTAPRKKTPKKVIIEEETPPEAPVAPVETPVERPAEPEISPRTALRDASALVRRAQSVKMQTRRSNLQEIYTRQLLSLP